MSEQLDAGELDDDVDDCSFARKLVAASVSTVSVLDKIHHVWTTTTAIGSGICFHLDK